MENAGCRRIAHAFHPTPLYAIQRFAFFIAALARREYLVSGQRASPTPPKRTSVRFTHLSSPCGTKSTLCCRLSKRYNADFSKYEPLVVAHKTNPKMLFCTLTGIELNRIPKQIEAHVNGKRFRNRKAEVEGLKQTQRQPAPEDSESDADDFWVRAVRYR